MRQPLMKDILRKISKMGPVWYIQTLKMFGDTLHGSIVAAHYKSIKPQNTKILWAMSERYIKEYGEFICPKIALPHGMTNQERVELARAVEKLPNVKKVIKPLVGIWGWNVGGSIADNVFFNAGIKKLNVPRKPHLPVGIKDYAWSDEIMRRNNLVNRKYGVLEYNSYSLSGPPHNAINSIDWYNEMLSKVQHPIVYIGGKNDPKLNYGIDLRGCTFRQAKVMIMRSKLMVGCGSGLTMVSCSNGVNVPLVEINIGDSISMNGCGYGKSKIVKRPTPNHLANIINKIIRKH
jgi:hypothetical protein